MKFCLQCSGALLPEWGNFTRCPTCRERNNAEHRSETGRARDARYRNGNRDRLNTENAAGMAAKYEAALELKLCVSNCGTPVSRFRRCADCRKRHAQWNRDYRARKAQGATP